MPNDGFGEEIQIPQIKLPRPPMNVIRGIIIAVVALIVIASSFYTVGPEEIGVVLRFGQFVRNTQPGLHLKAPFGVETVRKVPVQRQLKEEFGFRTTSVSGTRTEYSSRSFEGESLMLTGDLNAAVVDWVVQFRIVDQGADTKAE